LKELAVPDLDRIKQAEQVGRDGRGRFGRGGSGNPTGGPCGCRDDANRAARALFAGKSEALTRMAVELALEGDPAAQGAVTPREAMQLGQVVEAYVRAVEATEFGRRPRASEAGDTTSP
jgi:hypothetical protein